jgi:hypothetical protein
MDQFATHGGHGNQCKFKRTQKSQWIDTMKAFYTNVKAKGSPPDFVCIENEVNMYINTAEPDYSTTHKNLMDNIVGLLYLPNNVAPGTQVSPTILPLIKQLQQYLATMKLQVPIIQMNTEAPLKLDLWTPPANLSKYNFKIL